MKYERSNNFLEMEGSPEEIIRILNREDERNEQKMMKKIDKINDKLQNLSKKIDYVKEPIIQQDKNTILYIIQILKQDFGEEGWAAGEALHRIFSINKCDKNI